MPHMYILECSDGSYYVGSTVDLERRLVEHDQGEGSRYTRQRRPVQLVYAEEHARIDEAFAREKQVQNWSRAKREALIGGRLELLNGLSRKQPRSGRD
ncbi:GIY-YIG nuclease family protein [Agromyces salentinus]